MPDLPVIEDLRARVTNETADQRPDQRALRSLYQNFRITFCKMSAVTKVQKFPWIVSRNSGNCWISEMRTIQPKILAIPGAKVFLACSRNFRCVGWAYLLRSSSFSKFWNYSLPKVTKNSQRTFWLNGKRPVFSGSSVAWAVNRGVHSHSCIWVIRARWREIRRFVLELKAS